MRLKVSAGVLVSLCSFAGCGGADEPADHAAGHPHAGGEHHHPGHHGPGHHHDFSDVERFASIFDDPARDAWQRPAEVVARLELASGAVVADLGAGTGYFVPHLSAAVGASGRVLALDTEPAMVAHMERRLREAGLENAQARRVAPDDPGLAPGSVDRVLVVDTWHHLEDRVRYARQLAEALREGGFVLVVDFTEESPHGPPQSMRLSAETVRRELAEGGLAAEVVEAPLPYQFVVRGARR